MTKYLKEPVVLQWDMKTRDLGEDIQSIIEKKICKLSPIKIRYINPKSSNDFSTINRISEKTSVQYSQIEIDFFEITVEQMEKLHMMNKEFEYYLRFDRFNLEQSMYSKLKKLLQSKKNLNVITYFTDANVFECVELIKWIYHENSNITFFMYPNRKKANFLIYTSELHKVILEIIPLYKVCVDIKLSIYDSEKIVKDILPLNYYRHGNFYITARGTVSLYDFLPDYEYGLITTEKTIKEIWGNVLEEHGDSDLSNILKKQRYWFKYKNGGGI